MSNIIKTIAVCLIAGFGAGISTGFAGLSAAAFITPMLVTFLNLPVYMAVGIALASDVLASGVSAVTYYRHGNIDIKKAKSLLILVLLFAVLGSILAFLFVSTDSGETVMEYWSILGSTMLGVNLIKQWFVKKETKQPKDLGKNRKLIGYLLSCGIGLICGFQGTGGGMMLLFTLTVILLYDFKVAVGTSVLIMAFTAFIGAASHFVISGLPDPFVFVLCVISTTVFARIGARIANKIETRTLKLITGILLVLSGVVLFIAKSL